MKNYILFAAAALMLGACSNDENLDNLNGPVELRLTSGLEVQTRATHSLDTQLKNGEEVHVWVDDAKNTQTTVTKENIYENCILTAGDNGALSGETMYFPETGNQVNIYAIHGNFGDADFTDFWSAGQTHTIVQDQKSSGDGYAKSDLVYAKHTNVARTKQAVNLEFRHLLSKIEIVLVQGEGKPTIDKVEILYTKLDAKFTPDKTEENIAITASGTVEENPIEIDKDLTTKTDAEGTDESKKKLNEAIIVPQDLTKGTPFIRVTTAEGGKLIYRLPENKTFDPAKKYRFTVTANLTELKVVSAKITDWTKETGDENGTAEME